MGMCEELYQATGVQNRHDDTNIHIRVFSFASPSVFAVVVDKTLEGERDYDEHTLATPTFQRSHFRIGVVNMGLLSVKVQGAKSMLFIGRQNMCLYAPQKHNCAQQKTTVSVFHCLVMARIAFKKSKRLAPTKQ